jgi:hypothetical protein
MTNFEIVIDLVVTADNIDDVDAMLPNYGDITVRGFHDCKTLFDVTMFNKVAAETAEDAAATLDNDTRRDFSSIDSNWHGFVFEDDNEVLELERILE